MAPSALVNSAVWADPWNAALQAAGPWVPLIDALVILVEGTAGFADVAVQAQRGLPRTAMEHPRRRSTDRW